jgi:hypothetical protein
MSSLPIFETIFADLQVETARNIRMLATFNVSGNFRKVLSGTFFRKLIKERLAPYVKSRLSGRDVDRVLITVDRAVDGLTDRVSGKVESLSGDADSVDDLVAGLDDVSEFGRAQIFADNLDHLIGQYELLRDAAWSGFSRKTWVTVGDSRVRHSHGNVMVVTVRLRDEFVLGSGGRCQVPADESLSLEDSVGCRCTLTFS